MSISIIKNHQKLMRYGKWLFIFLSTTLVLLLVFLSVYFLSTKNQLDGEVLAQGLSSSVIVKFDENAIPHINAKNNEDAWYTLGFLHATERPWQMEFNRRLAAGKLSEILGPQTVALDKFIRTLGIRRSAEKQFDHFPIEYKRQLQAYAEGVNDGYRRLGWALPAEFMILGTQPAAWSPADSVAWSLMMALDLGGNWHKEFIRLELSKKLDTQRIWEVLPPYPGETAPTTVNFSKMYQEIGLFNKEPVKSTTSDLPAQVIDHSMGLAALRQLSQSLPGGVDGLGSNNWVVSGEKTVSGKPLLANDPHLGLTVPAIWYMAHIESPELNVMGATMPGIPGVVIGRTKQIAWGFTNTDPDVQDLYSEAGEKERKKR